MKLVLGAVIAILATMTLAMTPAYAEDDAPVAKRKVLKADTSKTDEEDEQQPARPARDCKANVSISPLGLLVGYLNVDLDFKLSQQWTAGPVLSYWSFKVTDSYYQDGIKATAWAIGARANWAKNGAYKNGMYLTPMFQYATSEVEGVTMSSGTRITASGSMPIISGLIGYQWFGQTLNMRVGIGPAVALGTSSKVKVSDGSTTVEVETSRTAGLAIDLMIGYVF